MPAHRTAHRPRDLHPTPLGQPHIDALLETKYDLHRLLRSAHGPRVPASTARATSHHDGDILDVFPADHNLVITLRR